MCNKTFQFLPSILYPVSECRTTMYILKGFSFNFTWILSNNWQYHRTHFFVSWFSISSTPFSACIYDAVIGANEHAIIYQFSFAIDYISLFNLFIYFFIFSYWQPRFNVLNLNVHGSSFSCIRTIAVWRRWKLSLMSFLTVWG